MYSGTTLRTKSGRIMGVHQRIDREAKRRIIKHIPRSVHFPNIADILHFEGYNGPDGIKRKSPGRDEPWHFIDPSDPDDRAILDMNSDHIHNLAVALNDKNNERAAFEAAWMAHAITDALTPAHHYPLEEKLQEIRGEGLETRNSKRAKIIQPGDSIYQKLQNNWQFWGVKGVMTTHLKFETGVAIAISSYKFDDDIFNQKDIGRLKKIGFEPMFYESLKRVTDLDMYSDIAADGWTRRLADLTRDVLLPEIIKMVAVGWYAAILETEK